MSHRHFRLVSLMGFLALGLLVSGAAAQEESAQFGAGLSMKFPYESFGDSYNNGYGIQGLFVYPFIPLLDISAGVGWNHFPQDEAAESVDIWEFVGGLRFRLGVFFMSGEVGYYTEVNDTSFLPGLGLKWEHFEVAWNIRAVSSGSWSGLRLGYYF